MFNLFLNIFILLSPIFFLSLNIPNIANLQFYQFGYFSNSINLSQLQFFEYSIAVLLVVSLFDNPKRFFNDDYFKFILIIYFINICLHPITIKTFPIIFLGFLLYYLVSVCMDYKNLKFIFYIIAFVSLLNTIFAILQFFNINFIYHSKKEIFGLMSYKTHLGIYQALAIPICYVLNPWLSIIPLIGLLLSKSMTAIVALVIGMIYFFRKNFVKIQSMPILMCCLSLIIVLFIKFFHKFNIRFEVWIETLKMIWDKLIFGYGVGTFKYISHTYTNNNQILNIEYTDPYSFYLGIAHALGIFGLIALLIFIVSNFKGVRNDILSRGLIASCLILVISGIGYSFMDYPRLAGTAIVLFGLINVMKGNNNENTV